jgi:hypothetical protein
MWVSPSGDMVAIDDADQLGLFPRHGRRHTIARDAHALAVAGTTAYWTQDGAAQSTTLAGQASSARDERLLSVGFGRSTSCEQRPGRTVFHSGVLRVARRSGTLFACRLFHRPVLPLPSHLGSFQVAHDRWLSGVDTCSHAAFVFDLGSGRTVTELPSFKARWSTTLLNDGTLAWIDDAGTLFAQAPDSAQATTLEAAGASALASSGRTVYWTAGGAPHSWTAPKPSPAPGAGDFAGCS